MSSFKDIVNNPDMRKLIEGGILRTIHKSVSFANEIFGTVWAYAIGPLTFFTAASCRSLHKELYVRDCHNPRVELEMRLRGVISDHQLWTSISVEADKPMPSPKALAIKLVQALVDAEVLRRRPFRVDQTNADAMLASMLLTIEKAE